MLVLYETALGYCLFKLTDSAKISSGDLWKEFETPEKANKLLVASIPHYTYTRILMSLVGNL
jgi:nucleolar protein 58